MYTRSCGGAPHPRSVLYPAFIPTTPWSARAAGVVLLDGRFSAKDAIRLIPSNEPSRLGIARKVGWSTVPSKDCKTTRVGGLVMIDGVGQGHGIGLCQTGSSAMAENGANIRKILAHYYPNAVLVNARPAGATR